MAQHRLKAVIFDFDGTLAPLNLDFSFLREEVSKIALKYVSESILGSLNHYHILEMIYELEGYLGEKGKIFRKEAFSKLRELEVEAASKKSLFFYTRGVLKKLKETNIIEGIITRTCIEAVVTVFPDYKSYIQAVVTRDDVTRVKPHPEHVMKILNILNIVAEEAIVVGDHPTDIIAGNLVGMKTLGVLTGRTKREDFLKVGATYVFQDIRGLINLI
ncbi:MAG: HAD family hydrolase [Deltaproteobacteria bacterium]|nr:HAD family hydrolase [Deltaproteobacteria bacterium]